MTFFWTSPTLRYKSISLFANINRPTFLKNLENSRGDQLSKLKRMKRQTSLSIHNTYHSNYSNNSNKVYDNSKSSYNKIPGGFKENRVN